MKKLIALVSATGVICALAGDSISKTPKNIIRPPPLCGVDESSFNAGVMTACLIIRNEGKVPNGHDDLARIVRDSWSWWTNEYNKVISK